MQRERWTKAIRDPTGFVECEETLLERLRADARDATRAFARGGWW